MLRAISYTLYQSMTSDAAYYAIKKDRLKGNDINAERMKIRTLSILIQLNGLRSTEMILHFTGKHRIFFDINSQQSLFFNYFPIVTKQYK